MSTKPLPDSGKHAPVDYLNHTGRGIGTIVGCSCGWLPNKASERGSTRCNAHMAHRRRLGLPRFDYSQIVMGEGPWMGWTWNEWWEEFGSKHVSEDISCWTGQPRNLSR